MTSFRAKRIELLPLSALRPAERNARTHSKRQLEQIKASIKRFGFTQPLLIDEACVIVAGHGRAAAAKALGMAEAPCIRIDTMTADEKRAYAIADNAIATKSGWDKEVLALELGELVDLGFDVEATGFELPEIDQLLLDADEAATTGPGQEDVAPPVPTPADAVCRPGDLWTLGRHKVLCGDAKDADAVSRLVGWEKADMVFTDAPYNLRIDGVARGRGKVRHREFVEASGEMSREQFTEFLRITFERMSSVCKDGAIIYSCMDWRHIGELLAAGAACQLELKNICVWAKSNFGQGSFYRSQHELVTVWKHGAAPHVNTFGLGEGGRTRSNLWRYAGLNAFKANRAEELSAHPTAKPVALVADAIRDVSHRGHIVLDPFGGSGTTLIAAEKTGRRARLIEIDGPYCDVIIRRWETYTGKSGVLEATGQDFETVAAERRAAAGGASSAAAQAA